MSIERSWKGAVGVLVALSLMAVAPLARAQAAGNATLQTAPGFTGADAALEGRVDGYLGSLDSPVSPAQWKSLGPGALAVLESRAFSADQLPSTRARAIEALGFVGTPAHGQKLAAIAGDEKSPLTVRLTALRSVGHLLPVDEARPVLTQLLQHDQNVNVRATAGDVLSRQPGKASCALVAKQAHAEKTSTQRMFSPALKRCQKSP